jgi:cytochrome c oxidase cbb3-type subunit 2
MIRPLRDEVERYGHYSLAAESMYDRPFQWGSKRTGPDLARVGGRYSDEWHRAHLVDPRSVVPESVMPPYAFLEGRDLRTGDLESHLKVNRMFRTPYTAAQVEHAAVDARAQANPLDDGAYDFEQRYPGVKSRDFDGDAQRLTEMDALIAYMQMLGAGVDFGSFDASAPENAR